MRLCDFQAWGLLDKVLSTCQFKIASKYYPSDSRYHSCIVRVVPFTLDRRYLDSTPVAHGVKSWDFPTRERLGALKPLSSSLQERNRQFEEDDDGSLRCRGAADALAKFDALLVVLRYWPMP